MKKILVSMSGGLDSTVLAMHAKRQGYHVTGIPFIYGSKHSQWEQLALDQLREARIVDLIHPVVSLNDIYDVVRHDAKASSLLSSSSKPIPEGHYQDEVMKSTVVPGRNLLFISALATFAETSGMDEIWLGVHAGDRHVYLDCRPEFCKAAVQVVRLSTNNKVKLQVPFIDLFKSDIVARGIAIGTPFQLTRTCYKDQQFACGKCGACVERLEAFQYNHKTDPLPYESK